jgi:hypothetical protein
MLKQIKKKIMKGSKQNKKNNKCFDEMLYYNKKDIKKIYSLKIL